MANTHSHQALHNVTLPRFPTNGQGNESGPKLCLFEYSIKPHFRHHPLCLQTVQKASRGNHGDCSSFSPVAHMHFWVYAFALNKTCFPAHLYLEFFLIWRQEPGPNLASSYPNTFLGSIVQNGSKVAADIVSWQHNTHVCGTAYNSLLSVTSGIFHTRYIARSAV